MGTGIRRRGRAPARVLAVAVLTGALALPATAGAQTTTRLGESAVTNEQAAIAYSQATFSDGAAPTVLLARDDDFVDSLSSGSAQGALEAPLLLTNSAVLTPEVMLEIQRLGAEEVRIMGGDEAVSPVVQAELEVMGLEVSRLMGAERTATAVDVARQLFPKATSVIIARAFPGEFDPSLAFADSITAGNYAAATRVPVLLTDEDVLSQTTLDYLNESSIESAVIAGGTDAISAEVEAQLAAIDTTRLGTGGGDPDITTFQVTRFAGFSRAGTAVELAGDLGFPTAADATRTILIESRGDDAWAAGLTAGAQTGNGAATVLSDGDQLFEETSAYLAGGGTPLVCGPRVPSAACDAAEAALGADS